MPPTGCERFFRILVGIMGAREGGPLEQLGSVVRKAGYRYTLDSDFFNLRKIGR